MVVATSTLVMWQCTRCDTVRRHRRNVEPCESTVTYVVSIGTATRAARKDATAITVS